MSSKPRLLEVAKAFYPVIGGVEKTVYDIATAAAREFDVTVLAVSEDRRSSTEAFKDFTVTKVGKLAKLFSMPISLGYLPRFRELARHADLVHVHSPYPLGELTLVLNPVKVPVIVTYHFDVVRQRAVAPLYNPILHAVLRRADRIVATNPNTPRSSPILRRYPDKVSAIPFGIRVEKFALSDTDKESVLTLRRGFSRPLVLFVGRLVYYKGVEHLIRATAQVDADFVIIGDGPLKEGLVRLATDIGVASRVHFLEYLPRRELFKYFHASDLFVLPSVAESEGFGLVLLEAMACGKPMVTTELGTGTSWINQHGETGFVVPPRDPDALAEAIKRLVSDEALRLKMGQAAYDRVCKVFTRREFGEAYTRLFRSLLSNASRP
jgi:rhamnosyl/mannosyltransferase